MNTTRAKIVFVDAAQWQKHLSRPYFLRKNSLKQCPPQRLLTGARLYATAETPYLVGTIMNHANCSLFHQISSIGNNVLTAAKKLTSADSPISICLSGGNARDSASVRHFQQVRQTLEKFKDQLSIFWGQKDHGDTGILCDTPHRVITICHDGSEIKKLADLNQVYQEVHIADGHEILFGEEHLPIVE